MEALKQLRDELLGILLDMRQLVEELGWRLATTHSSFRQSAENLVHYLALRRHDIRALQEELSELGLSSLGRTESHVMAAVEAVLRVVQQLSGEEPVPPSKCIDFTDGKVLLTSHTERLLGPAPGNRSVRIMVTMPSEAGLDYPLVRDLVANGMNCMRINCAHDDAMTWAGMVANVRRAERELSANCRVLMDLAGPKLRTGPIDPSTQILKWRPARDACGKVTGPAHVWLTSAEAPEPPPDPADATLTLPAAFLSTLREGARIGFRDLRDKKRVLVVEPAIGLSRWASASQTAYLQVNSTVAMSTGTNGDQAADAFVESSPAAEHYLNLRPGDALVLTREPVPGRPGEIGRDGQQAEPARISCTLPQVFSDVRARERIWFDDGKIGGVIESVSAEELRVRITIANVQGDKLRADKGINLPDTDLRLPALTDKDREDLRFVVAHADLVGYSFVRRAEDVKALQAELRRNNAEHVGIMLKIETRTAFEQLPNILLAAMCGPIVGVMIARGDLAVECGWERLAEIQEEILWVCEAAHIPVVWATQVLENLAKTGVPSRAEITDAAMGERAECVMLNKGPHLVAAVRVLDDILRRMEAHQSKKSARLRRLRLSNTVGT